MSTLKSIVFTIFSSLITSHKFGASGLHIWVCGIFSFQIPYDRITICDTRVWHNRIAIRTEPLEETVIKRVFVRTSRGFCVALRVNSIEEFASQLQKRVPQVHIRKLKDINRSVTL